MSELRRLRLGLKPAIRIQAFRTRKEALALRTSAPVVTSIIPLSLRKRKWMLCIVADGFGDI